MTFANRDILDIFAAYLHIKQNMVSKEISLKIYTFHYICSSKITLQFCRKQQHTKFRKDKQYTGSCS